MASSGGQTPTLEPSITAAVSRSAAGTGTSCLMCASSSWRGWSHCPIVLALGELGNCEQPCGHGAVFGSRVRPSGKPRRPARAPSRQGKELAMAIVPSTLGSAGLLSSEVLELRVTEHGPHARVVTVAGEIDALTAPQL